MGRWVVKISPGRRPEIAKTLKILIYLEKIMKIIEKGIDNMNNKLYNTLR